MLVRGRAGRPQALVSRPVPVLYTLVIGPPGAGVHSSSIPAFLGFFVVFLGFRAVTGITYSEELSVVYSVK